MWKSTGKAAKHFGVSVPTLRKLFLQGLPHSKLPSGVIRVNLDQADEWFKQFQVKDRAGEIANEILKGVTK